MMDAIIRALMIYAFLMLIFRLSGKRSLAQITTFDFILLLIIGEAIQQALLGDDFSLTNGFLVILTLVGADIGLSLLKQRFPPVERVIDGLPLVIVENGQPIEERLNKARVDEGDVLSAARRLQGLDRMDQIKYAVLERDGGITVIPQPDA
jgi:uncharacterized membrane protein YcaP (DUF421 family)